MNYRKFYEDAFGIKIPKDYDVHHLDFNRHNNDLCNLLLIPKTLHAALHKFERNKGLIIERSNGRFSFASQLDAAITADAFSEYANIAFAMQEWLYMKEAEMNKIPCGFNYDIFRLWANL